MLKHYADLRSEMNVDTKLLSEQSQIKTLQATKAALEKKLQKIQDDNRTFEKRLIEEQRQIDRLADESKEIKSEIRRLDSIDINDDKG